MLTIDLEEFMFELKDGVLKHVGASTNTATVKCYDIEETTVTEFGDERIKLVSEDDGGNVVELALDPAQARSVARDIESLAEESNIFE